jgi:hypothetical protein
LYLAFLAKYCELALDPEVAILFGREIGQSNGVFYLLIARICKDKSRLVTLIKVLVYNFLCFLVTTIFMSRLVEEKVIIFLSNFP